MEKKLTNSGPLRESADKHSIYPPQQVNFSTVYTTQLTISSHLANFALSGYVKEIVGTWDTSEPVSA